MQSYLSLLKTYKDFLPQHVWLLEPPSASIRAEVWFAVGLASLAAMLKARNLYFREVPSADHTLVNSRALELLSGALQDFATCQGCRSCLSDLGPAHPFITSRPNGSLSLSLRSASV